VADDDGVFCGNDNIDGSDFCDGTDTGTETCFTQGFASGTLGCLPDCTAYDYTPCVGGCGNGAWEVGESEDCDGTDLGDTSTDDCTENGFTGGTLGCTSLCAYDFSTCTGGCGNGAIETGESCDGANLGGTGYELCTDHSYLGGTLGCLGNCTDWDFTSCHMCGNDSIDSGETCDGTDLGGTGFELCTDHGFGSGTLACLGDCSAYDFTGCSGCGNDSVESGETCDGTDLGATTTDECSEHGYVDGTMACLGDCSDYDLTGCHMCGNDSVDGSETCDGTDLGSTTTDECTEHGYGGGTLACLGDCSDYDFTSCDPCGNATVDTGETCDGTTFISTSVDECTEHGFASGTLGCQGDCSDYDFATCVDGCGNGTADGSDECDGTDLGIYTDCAGLGYTGGSLTCTAGCMIDESACFSTCTNDTAETGEVCDGTDLGSTSTDECSENGFVDGTMACLSDCSDYDLSGCHMCGNNDASDAGEVCDGTDLDLNDCTTVPGGFSGGTLDCLADCSGWDTTGCVV
jgi:hypothetical protein